MIKILAQPFSALLFDMDGVLIDSEPLHFQSFRRVFAPMGLTLTDEYQYKFVGDPLWKNLKDIEKDFKITLNKESLKKAIQSAYMDILNQSDIATNPGIYELLRRAHRFQLKTGICTTSPLYQARIIRDRIEKRCPFSTTAPLFTKIVSGDHVQFNKPHPQPYLLLASQLGVKPASCIAIEDSFSGVTAAKKAGCFTIALLNNYHNKRDLQSADVIVSSLSHIDLG